MLSMPTSLSPQLTGQSSTPLDLLSVLNVTLPTDASVLADNVTDPARPLIIKPMWKVVLILILCCTITVGTILGNALVVLAVAIVRKLQTPSNLLIVSLAVSDFLVGLLVLPFAVMMEITDGYWILGDRLCDAWTSLDVLLCTASILNLCAISIDRYLVITRPFKYAMKRTPKRMFLMAASVWIVSALISIPPLLGWKTERKDGECGYSQNIGYQVYATLGAFYLPTIIMVVVYCRIYRLSHKLVKAEAKSKPAGETSNEGFSGPTTPLRKESDEPIPHPPHNGSAKKSDASHSSADILPKITVTQDNHRTTKCPIFKRAKLKGKENKATKTLGVIMGAFVACWLPFFILALIKPFCNDPSTCIPPLLNSLFLWLGYANSFGNPIIYARFNRDFRTPFKEIILCRCRGINNRLRHDAYHEQYGTGVVRSNSLRPPQGSVVKYNSQGQTVVNLGNGRLSTASNNGSTL